MLSLETKFQGQSQKWRAMTIRFVCPECQQLLGASTRKAGRQVPCPTCNATVTVPTEAEAAAASATRRFEHPEIEEALSKLAELDVAVRPTSDVQRTSAANAQSAGIERTMLLIPRAAIYLQAAILVIVAILFFLAGWWIGRASGRTTQAAVEVNWPLYLGVLVRGQDAAQLDAR
jgi:uncharacterized Zn finger protein (UPF0148 family)